ncbi:MAG: MarR family transcriptional regulator [Acidimicrobiales bacterium]
MPVHGTKSHLTADQLLTALASLRRTLRRRARRPAELFSLTWSQLELVRLVRRQPGVSVAEAASELRLAPNTVSTLVRQLTDLGLLSRRADTSDRRVARLDLSAEIRRKVDASRDRRLEALTSATGQLSVRERRALDEAVKVLARLAEYLDAEEQPISGETGSRPESAGRRLVGTIR